LYPAAKFLHAGFTRTICMSSERVRLLKSNAAKVCHHTSHPNDWPYNPIMQSQGFISEEQNASSRRFNQPKELSAAFARCVTVPSDDNDWVARNGKDSIFDLFQKVFPQVLVVHGMVTAIQHAHFPFLLKSNMLWGYVYVLCDKLTMSLI
jgi:hypothetical protein